MKYKKELQFIRDRKMQAEENQKPNKQNPYFEWMDQKHFPIYFPQRKKYKK